MQRLAGVLVAVSLTPLVLCAQVLARAMITDPLRIGSVDDPEYSFMGVTAVRPMADGRIAAIIWAPGKTELRVFDSTGRTEWKRTFSTNQYASTLAVSGDTLAVTVGFGGEKVVLLFRAGHDAPIASLPSADGLGNDVSLLGSLSGPFITLSTNHAVPNGRTSSALARPTHELRALNAGRTPGAPLLLHIDSTPRALIPLQLGVGTATVGAQLPWVERPSFAAAGGRVFFARGLNYEIVVTDVAGKSVRNISASFVAKPIAPEKHDAWFAEYRRGPQRSLYPDSSFDAIRALPSPPHLPVVGALFASAAGELAVVRADDHPNPVLANRATFVDILTPDGTPRAGFYLQPGMQIQAFTGTEIYATFRDTTQVAGRSTERGACPLPLVQIVRYRLVR